MPPTESLRKMTVTAITSALDDGVMRSQGAALTAAEKRDVAAYLGIAGAAPAAAAPPCPGETRWTAPASSPSWSGWSPGLANWRFQNDTASGLNAATVPRLQLAWAYAFPGATNMHVQPAVYRGRVYVGSPDGTVVSLDAVTGCSYWTARAAAQVRTGITLADAGGRSLAYLGDTAGFVYAFDARTGAAVWKRRLDEHQAAMETATPVFHDGVLYVGVGSYEESAAARADYLCCTFRGSISALDAATGAPLWKTWTIPDSARPQPENKHGKKVMGPSGAGIWAAPTIDAAAGLLYVTTGDNYSDPATDTSDAVLALSLKDGRIVWSRQLTSGDAFNSSCGAGPNCPDSSGPDFDLGSSAMLTTLPSGRRVLLAGQKSGRIHALDPDKKGELLWSTRVGKGGALGGIQWGPATDGTRVYAAVSDIAFRRANTPRGFEPDPNTGGGISALRPDNGEILWSTPAPGCGDRHPCSPAQSSAISVIGGAVFSASLDGHLRAYDAATGKIVWDFDAAREFQTVNGVKGTGGSFDCGGPVAAGGMLFTASGYAQWGGLPGNVLLAFAPAR